MELSSRTRTRIGLVGLVVLVAAVAARFALPASPPDGPGRAVGLIALSGQIVDAAPAFPTGVITPGMVRDRLDSAAADPRVGAVVVRLNSPGGAPAASREILDALADHPQPVVVSMGDQATSGGYYAALGAERIVAHRSTVTGSIGVILTTIDPSELLDDLGVEIEAITSGEHKDMFLPGRLDDEARAILQRQSDRIYDEFVAAVAERRELPEAQVRELATGETFTGGQALDAGLVDEVGGLDTAVEAAADLAGLRRPEVIEVGPGLLEQLGGAAPALEALGGPDPVRQLRALRDELVAPPRARLQQEGDTP